MYVILAAATAGAIAPTTGIGVRNLIGRNGHRIDAANQLGGLRLLVGSNERVLSRLRSLEFQGLVLSSQRGDLVLGQEIQNRPAVGVCVVDDIPGVALHQVPGSAVLGGDGVLQILGGRPLVAAALGHLRAQGIEARLSLIAQVTHSSVHTVESAGHGVPDGGLAVLQAVQGKAFVDVRTGCPALETGAVGTTIAAAEAAAIAAPAEHAEDQKQDNPGGPIATPAKTTITAALISGSNRHCHNSAAVRRKTHDVISFVDLFSKPGRDFDQDKEM